MNKTPQTPRNNNGALNRLGSSVRNLFFYSAEEKAAQQSKAPAPEAPPESRDDNDVTLLLAIGRNNKDNTCIITIDGHRFNSWQELKQAGYAEQFVAIIDELRRHSHQAQPQEQNPPIEPEQADIEDIPSVTEPGPVPTLPVVNPEPAAVEQLPPTPPPNQKSPARKPEQDEALGSFMGNMRKAVRNRGKQEKVQPSMSIADQIDEIVQERLANNAAMRDRHIHIRPSLDGPLSILVADKHYEAVVDIEDEDVRAFVQEAIREWERTT